MDEEPTIEINNIWSEVKYLPIKANLNLYNILSYEVPGAYWIRLNKPSWDGRKHLYKKRYNRKDAGQFLTGLLSRVIVILYKDFNIKPKLLDLRNKPNKTLNLKWNNEKYELRDYQKETVESCLDKGRGIIELATGSGKTIVTSKVIQELGISPFIFYVLTKDLLYQTKEKLEDSIPGEKIGIIGNGECNIKNINVVTIQTACRSYNEAIIGEIKKYDDFDEEEIKLLNEEDFSHIAHKRKEIQNLIENTAGIYFDEVHHSPASTCQKILSKSQKAYYRFGGSATPYRADNATLAIEGLFGRKRAEVDASRLIKEGYLEKPKIFYINIKAKKTRVNNYEEDYKSHIVEHEERNNHIIEICKLLKENKIPTLVLVQRIDHGKFLNSKIDESVFIQGISSKKKRRESLKKLDNGEIPILIATSLADEGLDLPSLSALILAGGGKSITRVKQRVGRVIRKHPNKKCALVFDFLDIGRWVSGHSKKRRRILKTEKQFVIQNIDQFIFDKKLIQKELF